jgi:hypothetical protein
MTTLASTTGMTARLFQPAPALLDHQIGRRLMGSPPTTHGGFRQPCPFSERKWSLFACSGQGLNVAASHNEPIASPLRRQPAGPDPSTNRFSRAPGDASGSLDVQLVRWR